MPEKKVTREEFRDLCGVEGYPLNDSTLRSQIKKGNVIIAEDRMIDIFNPVNDKFIQERKIYEASKNKVAEDRHEIESAKKKLDLEKSQEELMISRIKRQQLEGKVIPTALVKRIFAIHFKSVTQAHYQAAGTLASDMVKRLKGSEKDLAYIKGQLIAVINDAVDKAQISSKAEVQQLVDQFSQKRGKGERL